MNRRNKSIFLGFLLVFIIFGVVFAGKNFFQNMQKSEMGNEKEIVKEDLGGGYSKDGLTVYVKDNPVDFFDVQTFEVLDRFFDIVRDKNGVYRGLQEVTKFYPTMQFGKYGYTLDEETFRLYDNLDLSAVTKFPGYYTSDSQKIFFKTQEVLDADPQTFEALGFGYAKDENTVYFQGEVLDADIRTFRIPPIDDEQFGEAYKDFSFMRDGYAVDKNWIYYENRRIAPYDKTVKVIDVIEGVAETHAKRYTKGNSFDILFGSWRLGSGNPEDSCSRPYYTGRVKVSGWYIFDYNYSQKEWLFRISNKDLDVFPPQPPFSFGDKNPRVKIGNLSPKLEEKLQKTSAKNPYKITITGIYYYCEGVPWVNIEE